MFIAALHSMLWAINTNVTEMTKRYGNDQPRYGNDQPCNGNDVYCHEAPNGEKTNKNKNNRHIEITILWIEYLFDGQSWNGNQKQ